MLDIEFPIAFEPESRCRWDNLRCGYDAGYSSFGGGGGGGGKPKILQPQNMSSLNAAANRVEYVEEARDPSTG